MNTKMIRYILAKMLGVEALLLLLPAFVSLLYRETEGIYFLIPAAVLTVIYLLAGRKKPKQAEIYGKEGMVVVASAWILWSMFGALPFTLSGCIPNYIDALFETVSGFTTTGSTILTDVEALPQGMLFWRSFTHWVGGMGVLVFVMVLTSFDKNSMVLMRAEVPGPEKDKLAPKMMTNARILYGMYLGLSIIQVVLLLFGGMNLFDSLIHTFGTAGTGGFSNYAVSVAYFDSAYIDGVITVFMILFGINFSLYYLLLLREFKPVWKNEELRTYLGIILASALIITVNINYIYGNPVTSFRYAIFQVASIITTTGFATANYVEWPWLSQTILMFLMVVGACASSTGGGIKVSRILLMAKAYKRELAVALHPNIVKKVHMDGKAADENVLRNTGVYVFIYFVIFTVSVLIVSLDGFDWLTTFTSVAATFNNIGPGFGVVGTMGNFSSLSDLSKWVLSLDMLIGRLEIFPIMLLFVKNTWRRF